MVPNAKLRKAHLIAAAALAVCGILAAIPFTRMQLMARAGSPKAMMQLARFYFSRADGEDRGNAWLLKSAKAGNNEAAWWIRLGHDPAILDCFSWAKGPVEVPEGTKRMRNELNRYLEEQERKGKPVQFRSFN